MNLDCVIYIDTDDYTCSALNSLNQIIETKTNCDVNVRDLL